jgi:hypothetical protein
MLPVPQAYTHNGIEESQYNPQIDFYSSEAAERQHSKDTTVIDQVEKFLFFSLKQP